MTGLKQNAPAHSVIGSQIHLLRDQRVMLDSDLAELYGNQTSIAERAFEAKKYR